MRSRVTRTYALVPALLAAPLATVKTDVQSGVSGHVFVDANGNGRRDAGERGVPSVAVSNQDEVVRTGADGAYTLSAIGPTGIVFVSVPDGFRAHGAFYRQLARTGNAAESVDFPLAPQPARESLTFVHASDTHIAGPVVARTRRLKALVDSIKPAFVLITGDLVRDALRVGEAEATGYYELFATETAAFGAPLYTVPGNHENFGIETALSKVSPDHPLFGRAMYRHYRGPDYYSFTTGGVHFVGLNSVDIDDTRYYGHVDSLQLAWLARDLAVLPPAMPVVTFNHIPFYSSMEIVNGLSERPPAPSVITVNGKSQFRHTVANAADVLAAIKGHPFPLALAGHVHARERLRFEGVPTRFDQAAAIVSPSPASIGILRSGITVYRITRGQVDEGRFVPLGLDSSGRR